MSVYSKKAVEIIENKIKSILYVPIDLAFFITNGVKYALSKEKSFPIVGMIPILGNNHMNAGGLDRHYFLQDIYMARKIRDNKTISHFDIGSRTDGFISHLLCDNIDVTMIDIRPLPNLVEGLSFIQGDATNLEQFETESIDSLSTLHAIEHFGLSRYGDKFDISACDKAMQSIQRVMKQGGKLYFSVPISSRNGLVYNSHRVFEPRYIIEQFDKMQLLSFAYIHDYKVFEFFGEEAKKVIDENKFNEYDCGMFVFEKVIS